MENLLVVSQALFLRIAPLALGKSTIVPVSVKYRKVSNIRRTKSQNFNASRLIL